MSVESYSAKKVRLRSAALEVLILHVPDTDIDGLLTALTPGPNFSVHRYIYEDFILSACMVHSGPVFYTIFKRPDLIVKSNQIRDEILQSLYEISPGFKPEGVVINREGQLQLRTNLKNGDDSIDLVSNPGWDKNPDFDLYTERMAKTDPARQGTSTKEILENLFSRFESGEPLFRELGVMPEDEEGNVDFEVSSHRWDRLGGMFLNIRSYDPADPTAVEEILKGVYVASLEAYQIVLLDRCIEFYGELLKMIAGQGLASDERAARAIIQELYEVVLTYNPFLDFSNPEVQSVLNANKKTAKSPPKSRRTPENPFQNRSQPARPRRQRTADGEEDDEADSGSWAKNLNEVPREKIINLKEVLDKEIIGQSEATSVISQAVQRACALRNENEPLGVFLFTGPTGSGKTQCAKALAKALNAYLIRLDCQEYSLPHEVAKLAGAPPGYAHHEEGGHLTKEVKKHPFAVVLFDELEKAHSNLHERLLRIMDEGFLKSNKGHKVSFTNTIIIMTSNVGVAGAAAVDNALGVRLAESTNSDGRKEKARKSALAVRFSPEFLGRIEETVNFRTLNREDYLSILDLILGALQEQALSKKGVRLLFSQSVRNHLLDKGVDQKTGARLLKKTVKKYVTNPLALALLKGEVKDKSKVVVSYNKDSDSVNFTPIKRGESAEVEAELLAQ